jgi:hypothetical protein
VQARGSRAELSTGRGSSTAAQQEVNSTAVWEEGSSTAAQQEVDRLSTGEENICYPRWWKQQQQQQQQQQ